MRNNEDGPEANTRHCNDEGKKYYSPIESKTTCHSILDDPETEMMRNNQGATLRGLSKAAFYVMKEEFSLLVVSIEAHQCLP